MKSIRIVLSPTRSRPLNVFLGLVLLLVSLLLVPLARHLLTRRPIAEHRHRPAPRAAIGPASSAPGSLICCCNRSASQPFSSPLARRNRLDLDAFAPRRLGLAALDRHLAGAFFLPAVFALLPWHWRWLHQLPIEGVLGRLMAGLLVRYLNRPGRLAGCRRLGRSRTLLCLRRQFLGNQREHAGSLVARRLLARPLAQLARRARRTP